MRQKAPAHWLHLQVCAMQQLSCCWWPTVCWTIFHTLYFSLPINTNTIKYAYYQLPSGACNSWWHRRRSLYLFWWCNDKIAWTRSTCSWTNVGKFGLPLAIVFINVFLTRLLCFPRLTKLCIPRTRRCLHLLQAWKENHTLSMSSWLRMISLQPIKASLLPVLSTNMNVHHYPNLLSM